ncbi:hypothetical protein [Promicromonospora iranensis]|uniref:DUF3592 domain-containing protein n=1 Tax=Promicromonospora iranensis TaxID=1105144 RepID=A0ABU2CSR4_9MICO|nr:hypothetical protein [Promicromonospora iranensis]MDR7384382.1 hypothetical protein [Promicromonospora iranensis]
MAHDLYQSGAEAQAHDAEVYYRSCRGCESELRAVVEYPDGPRTLPDLPSISFDRDGLPKGRWVVAPPPYDGTFQVLYDPDDPTDPGTIMTVDDVEDEVYQDGPLVTWVVVGALLTFGLVLMRPTVRSAVEAHHRFGAARRTIDAHLDLLHGSADDDDVLRMQVRDAVDGATDRSQARLRRERIRDLVMAVGIVLVAVSVLMWATSGREAVIAYHLQDAGVETKAFDALVTIDTRDDRTVSTKVFAEVRDTGVTAEYHDVELVVPERYIDEQLEPGWYSNVEPYRDGFVVVQDPEQPEWAVPLGDLDHLAQPGAIVLPSAVGVVGIASCVGVLVWPARRLRPESGVLYRRSQ